MDLIPITRIKISKERWLNTPIKYDNELKVKDIIEEMSEKSYNWILSKEDLEVLTDYDTFKNEFINFLYDKYLK